jgi:hypothetical protein
MKIVIFDTALPIAHGTPRQVAAEHRRAALAAGAAGEAATLRHVTIDAWGTEWSSRLRMAQGDRLFGARRSATAGRAQPTDPEAPRDLLALPRLAAETSVRASDLTVADPAAAWISPRRLARLAALVAAEAPDLIAVGDPLLVPVAIQAAAGAGAITGRVPQVRLMCRQAAGWHRLTARRLIAAGESGWHLRLAELIEAGTDPKWAPGLRPGPELPPMTFAFDPLYLAKTRSVLAVATGHAWLDRETAGWLAAAAAELEARGAGAPEIALLGFPKVLADRVPGARAYDEWQHLAALVGAARAVLLPWLHPAMTRLAEAALSIGTPVIVDPADAALAGLADREGVVPFQPAGLGAILAILGDPDLIGEDSFAAVARAARARAGVDMVAAADSPPAPTRPRRIDPVIGAPAVFYNPLSRLLLLRLQYRNGSGIEEVRLYDPAGNEINRLMPSAAQKRRPVIAIEGGAVIDRDAIGAGLRIELHDMEGLVRALFVPAESFVDQEAEIAMIESRGVMLHGAFWARTTDPAARWAIGNDAFQAGIGAAAAVPMPDLGAVAVPFAVPLQATPGMAIAVWRRSGEGMLQRPQQRDFVGTRTMAALAAAEPSPAVTALRGRHAGQRAWIIGNGPSVRYADLARIPPGDVIFCFNRFYLSYGEHPLRETYVVSADTLMIEDFGQEMIDIAAGLPLFCVGAGTTAHLKGPHVLLSASDSYLPVFSPDAGRFVSVGGSSVFVALQMAYYMGIRDVVLYGIDYSFSMKLRRDPRFPFPVSFEEGNHFIPSYRSAKPWCPPTWRDISAGFLNARVAFEVSGGRVTNATRGGRLETFVRADFDTLVGGTGGPGG